MKNLKKERKNGRKKFLDEVTRAFGGDNLGGGRIVYLLNINKLLFYIILII